MITFDSITADKIMILFCLHAVEVLYKILFYDKQMTVICELILSPFSQAGLEQIQSMGSK